MYNKSLITAECRSLNIENPSMHSKVMALFDFFHTNQKSKIAKNYFVNPRELFLTAIFILRIAEPIFEV